MDAPLFENAHNALVFAFNFSSQQYALSPMAKMMKTGVIGTGRGLAALDGSAQAGLIRAQVDRLKPTHRACIVARYSPRFEECSFCGGHEKMLEEYKLALVVLRDWALTQFSGLSVTQMRECIIRSFFERGVNVYQYADKLNIAHRTVRDQRQKIWPGLKKMDGQAQNEIAELLQPMCESSQNVS